MHAPHDFQRRARVVLQHRLAREVDAHGVLPALELDEARRRGPQLPPGQRPRVERRGHDDDLERRQDVGLPGRARPLELRPPQRDAPPQQPQQQIRRQRPLVRLVDDGGAVVPQQQVALELAQQDAVGLEDEARRGPQAAAVVARPVGDERVARGAGVGRAELARDALRGGHDGDAPRLRGDDAQAPRPAEPGLVEELRHLRRLARARRAAQDDDVRAAHRVDDLLLGAARREAQPRRALRRGAADPRHPRGPRVRRCGSA